ncbi:MAG: hypothetical protein EXR79_12370 [Myxococcales bacterium]|nr:hypothetical protein [Myxococcales bacterium]
MAFDRFTLLHLGNFWRFRVADPLVDLLGRLVARGVPAAVDVLVYVAEPCARQRSAAPTPNQRRRRPAHAASATASSCNGSGCARPPVWKITLSDLRLHPENGTHAMPHRPTARRRKATWATVHWSDGKASVA